MLILMVWRSARSLDAKMCARDWHPRFAPEGEQLFALALRSAAENLPARSVHVFMKFLASFQLVNVLISLRVGWHMKTNISLTLIVDRSKVLYLQCLGIPVTSG